LKWLIMKVTFFSSVAIAAIAANSAKATTQSETKLSETEAVHAMHLLDNDADNLVEIDSDA